MTREEKQKAIYVLKKSAPVMPLTQEDISDRIQAINQVIDWLEQEPCDDCVSRKFMHELGATCIATRNENGKLIALGAIDELPSVTPIRPKGHWYIDERPESNREVICSNCEQPIFRYHELYFDYRPKYCPNCSADMREVEDGNDNC